MPAAQATLRARGVQPIVLGTFFVIGVAIGSVRAQGATDSTVCRYSPSNMTTPIRLSARRSRSRGFIQQPSWARAQLDRKQ